MENVGKVELSCYVREDYLQDIVVACGTSATPAAHLVAMRQHKKAWNYAKHRILRDQMFEWKGKDC